VNNDDERVTNKIKIKRDIVTLTEQDLKTKQASEYVKRWIVRSHAISQAILRVKDKNAG